MHTAWIRQLAPVGRLHAPQVLRLVLHQSFKIPQEGLRCGGVQYPSARCDSAHSGSAAPDRASEADS